jgi:hypothetical protein
VKKREVAAQIEQETVQKTPNVSAFSEILLYGSTATQIEQDFGKND